MLTLQLSVLSAVPHVLCTSTIASSCMLYGNRDPNCRGYTATEENSGDRGCAGAYMTRVLPQLLSDQPGHQHNQSRVPQPELALSKML